MTENKQFVSIDDGLDFSIKHIESGEIFYDCDSVVNILNELAEENRQLKEERELAMRLSRECDTLTIKKQELQERNNRQAKQLDNLYTLIEKQDWKNLTGLIQEFQECEEQLQKEWK